MIFESPKHLDISVSNRSSNSGVFNIPLFISPAKGNKMGWWFPKCSLMCRHFGVFKKNEKCDFARVPEGNDQRGKKNHLNYIAANWKQVSVDEDG